MNLREDTLVYKWASFGRFLQQKLLKTAAYERESMPGILSLCELGRLMFFWPLAYLFMFMASFGFIIGVTIYSMVSHGPVGLWYVFQVPIAISVVTLGVVVILYFVVNYFQNSPEDKNSPENVARRERGEYTPMEVAAKYVKTTKAKVCPIITIKKV